MACREASKMACKWPAARPAIWKVACEMAVNCVGRRTASSRDIRPAALAKLWQLQHPAKMVTNMTVLGSSRRAVRDFVFREA